MSFIHVLCSSSQGNCYYIGDAKQGVLIDAGVGIRSFTAQCKSLDLPLSAVQGMFITHEHTDHIKGLARIDRQLKVPVYTAPKTAKVLAEKQCVDPDRLVSFDRVMAIGDLEVTAFATDHDAVQSQGYVVRLQNGKRIGFCTDLGQITPSVHEQLCGCDTVVLESNYEKNLLSVGPYPYFLKQRIAGKFGHLSNEEAGVEMKRLLHSGTKQFLLAHLSKENNHPELAFGSAVEHLTETGAVLAQDYHLRIAPRLGGEDKILL